MTPYIGQYLEEDALPKGPSHSLHHYAKIDALIELVPCMECKATYAAAETFDPIQPPGQDASDWVKAFILLTGKRPMGKIQIEFKKLGTYTGDGELLLSDSAGSAHSFAVQVLNRIGGFVDSAPLFLGHTNVPTHSFNVNYLAKIETLTGKKLQVALNYNSDGHKVMIIPIGEDYNYFPAPIFVSKDLPDLN